MNHATSFSSACHTRKNEPMELLHSHFLGQATVCATWQGSCVASASWAMTQLAYRRTPMQYSLRGLSSPGYCNFEELQAASRHKALVFSNNQRRHLSHPDVASNLSRHVTALKCNQLILCVFEFPAMRITKFVKYLCAIIGLQGRPHLLAQPLCSFCTCVRWMSALRHKALSLNLLPPTSTPYLCNAILAFKLRPIVKTSARKQRLCRT